MRNHHGMLLKSFSHSQQRVGLNQGQVRRQDEPAMGIKRCSHTAGDAVAHAGIGQVCRMYSLHHMPWQATGTYSCQDVLTHRLATEQRLEFVLRGT
jgi:hypothetical protein